MTGSRNRAEVWLRALEPFTRRPFDPSRLRPRIALLVVDMQRYFIDETGDAFLPFGREALGRVKRLLDAFRSAGFPVVFTRHEDRPGDHQGAMGRWWGSIMEPDDPQLEIVPELGPQTGELVIRKHQYSAFHQTSLADSLNSLDVKSVVVSGVMTHLCCETTARAAFMEDFDVCLPVDAMATSSVELHLAALKTLVNGFAVPATVEEICLAVAGG